METRSVCPRLTWSHGIQTTIDQECYNDPCPRYITKNIGCCFFAYSWKLPAYSGAFLLTIDSFSFFTYSWSFFFPLAVLAFSLTIGAFLLTVGKCVLISASRDCRQRSSTLSKKAPRASKKASPQTRRTDKGFVPSSTSFH